MGRRRTREGLLFNDRRIALRRLLAGGALLALWPRAALARDPVVYTYDALGRLTSATYPSGVTVVYTYDAAGNRLQVWAGSGPPPPPPPPALIVSLSATTWSSMSGVDDPPIQVSVTGGVPPYAYAWQRLSGHQFTVADNPYGSSTGWYVSGGTLFPPIKNSVWRCQVTDAAGTSLFTSNVSVSVDVS